MADIDPNDPSLRPQFAPENADNSGGMGPSGSSPSVGGITASTSAPTNNGVPAFNLNDPGFINYLSSQSIQSSAPPYKPILGDTGSQTVANQLKQNATNPTLPDQAQFDYQNIANPDQYLAGNIHAQPTINGQYQQAGFSSMNPVTGAGIYSAEAGQVNTNQAGYYGNQASLTGTNLADPNVAAKTPANTYDATQTVDANGNVNPNSLVQNQFDQIMHGANTDENGVPEFAKVANAAARQQMAAMGLGASTLAANATAGAILQAAMPMAIQNSQTVANAINNSAAWDNAAKQFNATSKNQTDQFFAGLQANLAQFNATQANAVGEFNSQAINDINKTTQALWTQENTFNTGQANQVALANAAARTDVSKTNAALAEQASQFNASESNKAAAISQAQKNAEEIANAQLRSTVDQFNANLLTQTDQFNATNDLAIQQSNLQWRRAVNVADTAGTNAANQANAMNYFNMSQTALNNLWQQAQDEASWALSAGENSQNRALSLASSALNRQTSLDILNSTLKAQQNAALGGFAASVLGNSGSIIKGVGSLFGGNDSSSGGDFGGGGDTASNVGDFGGGGDSVFS